MEPRKRKRLLLALAGLVALVAGLWLVLNHNAEPTYEGRSLSEWISAYQGPFTTLDQPTRMQAAEAICAIGTNRLPWLLSAIDCEPGKWRLVVGRFARRLPDSITRGDPVVRLYYNSPEVKRANLAMTAFRVLGPIAAPAIPELAQKLQLTNSPIRSERALVALSNLGPKAVPVFANLLSSPEIAAFGRATYCLSNLGTNARPLIPILVRNLGRGNIDIIQASTTGLRSIADHQEVLAALTQGLTDIDVNIRRETARALGAYGAAAKVALPTLVNALEDTNQHVRTSAYYTIVKIDPDALPILQPE